MDQTHRPRFAEGNHEERSTAKISHPPDVFPLQAIHQGRPGVVMVLLNQDIRSIRFEPCDHG